MEALLDEEAEAITRKAIERAKEGDPVALRLVLERILPVRKGRPVQFELGPLESAADVSAMIGSIISAAAHGELTPDEASTIAQVVEVKRRAIETQELEARLAALEASQDATK